MKTVFPALLVLLSALVVGAPGRGDDPQQRPVHGVATGAEAPAGGLPCARARGFRWTHDCFPRCGCPDDYCPNPYPRQCWPPYPSFYQCVPAGDCAPHNCVRGNDRTWWFIPTPRALREALWCQP